MNAFLRVALLVVRKDLMVEARSFELVTTTLFFAVTVVLVFAFGLVREGRAVDDVAAAVLWIAMAFSGTLALGRTFERERQADTLRALMLAPADRPAIYAGKLAGMLLWASWSWSCALIGLLFQAPISRTPAAGRLLIAARRALRRWLVGDAGARSRDVMLPILLYPITVPVMIAGVRGTAALFQSTPDEGLAQFWIALLLFFDVVFVTLALWTFEPVMTE
jgi:heme exporter protein CcmB